MKSRTAVRLLLLLLLVVPGRLAAQSQSAGGSIEGTVTDESGAVLPGATVTVRNQATGVVRETTTDGSGVFRAPLLPVGLYEVTAALAGLRHHQAPEPVARPSARPWSIDLSLKVAAAQEEVTVTAEAPVIETTRTQQASTVGERAVANLPVNGRNFIDFVLTTPGVTRDVRARRHQLRRPARHAEQPGDRRRRQQQHLLRPDPRPHRLGPRALPVQPGRGAGVPGEPQRLLGRVRPRRRRGDQRGHQVGHQRLPRLGLRVLPRQEPEREQLRQQDRGTPIRPARPSASTSSAARWAARIVKDKAFFFLSYDGAAAAPSRTT